MSRIAALFISALVTCSACGGEVSVYGSDGADASGAQGGSSGAKAEGGAQVGTGGASMDDDAAGVLSDGPWETVADVTSESDGAIEVGKDALIDLDALAEMDVWSEAEAQGDVTLDSSAGPDSQTDAQIDSHDAPVEASIDVVSEDGATCESGCSDAGAEATVDDGGSEGACAPPACLVVTCFEQVRECGDCIDNDADGLVDMADPDCIGPCGQSEASLAEEYEVSAPCSRDCYFDSGAGSGDDTCVWRSYCDPLSKNMPTYPEYGCKYKSLPECASWMTEQSAMCHQLCEPLTPNGCDCFGCCEYPAASGEYVFLGSGRYENAHRCSWAVINDPSWCHPCTPVPSCFNPCEGCEMCFGMTALPAGCDQQQCPSGSQACGQPCQPGCPAQHFCLTGCCVPTPPWNG